jgi:hypothetical protein
MVLPPRCEIFCSITDYQNRNALDGSLAAIAGVNLSTVILDARASTTVSSSDILGSVGAVRFFSIDGIIALEDFLRPEWPDVSAGYFAWFAERSKTIVPFVIGFDKLYLCEQSHVASYWEVLRNSEFLNFFLTKHYDFCGNEIPVFQKMGVEEARCGIREALSSRSIREPESLTIPAAPVSVAREEPPPE